MHGTSEWQDQLGGAAVSTVLRRVAVAVVVCLTPAMAVGAPVFADPPGPTDYLSEVRSVVPETPSIDVAIVGGDSFFELGVDPGVEAIVLGYQGERYVWFRADGAVFENQNSPAAYLNASRYGDQEVPASVSADAPPDWTQVATGGRWAWHDHRAHWMQNARPFGLGPGDQILEAVIPVIVDGTTTEVTVISTWQPEPSPLPAWLGAVVGLAAAIAVWFLRRRSSAPLVVAAPLIGLSVLALIIGAAQYFSLPAVTGPRPIWVLLALVAVLSAMAVWLAAVRGWGFAADAAMLLVGVELAIWGFTKRDGLSAAILPTDAPFWLDRFTTAGAIAGGVAVTALALWGLFAAGTSASSTTPTAVSDSRAPSG